MKQSSMVGNAILPAFKMAPHEEWRDYLEAARYLFQGAKVLADAENKTDKACSFLCAQTLECLLKAYLAKRDTNKERKYLDRDVRHNLDRLWNMAVTTGFELSAQPPHWCNNLSAHHKFSYVFRYLSGSNFITITPVSTVVAELQKIFDLTQTAVKN